VEKGSIDILGKSYRVRVKEIDESVARVNYSLQIIEINPCQKGQKFDECLIHEIIHATFDRIGVGSTKLNSDIEEIFCDSIAKVISENFKLVRRK
jgi:hypothetical protein